MSLCFLKEDKKVKKANAMVVFGEGFARWEVSSRPAVAAVAVSRRCRASLGGQTGREPQPPDGTRDNHHLSRHPYLLQRSTGTGQQTFSRESHTKFLRGPCLAGRMSLEWVCAQKLQRQGYLHLLQGCRLQPPRSLAGLDSGHVTDEPIPFFHIFTWCSLSWLRLRTERSL